jgi:hypothetical protein
MASASLLGPELDRPHLTETMRQEAFTLTTARIVFLVAIVAIVVVILVTGWADDRAEPGSSGRVPVATATPTPD